MRTSRIPGVRDTEPRGIEQRAFDFTVAVVQLARQLETDLPHALADRLVNEAVTFGESISEVETHSSARGQISRLVTARRAARDVAFVLRILAACDILAQEPARALLRESQSLHEVLTNLLLKARQEKDSDSG